MNTTERRFTSTKSIRGGKPATGNIIRCGKCETTETHWPKPGLNPIVSKKYFLRQGWSVGKGPRADRCPDCLKNIGQSGVFADKLPAAIKKKEETEHMLTKPKEPRKLGRDERRLIFAKLEDVYVDEKTGYELGWTDQKLADDLGVPRAWVTTIRDENFGALATNVESSKDMEKLDQVMVGVDAGIAFVKKELVALEKYKSTVRAIKERLEKSLAA